MTLQVARLTHINTLLVERTFFSRKARQGLIIATEYLLKLSLFLLLCSDRSRFNDSMAKTPV